jgi:D-alanyl-D-alanine carboxypeptidase/D-alanyl-D-alanine-endopeptidase (penicillin-binding protein 4)
LYADGLLKASFSEKSKYATFAESTAKLGTYWQERGVNWTGFRIEDGSGLSSQNLIQAKNYSQFLGQLISTSNFPVFLQTIPQMGVSGTVKNLPKTKRPIYVKSGTINGVKTYAGYLKNKDGDWLTFFVGVDRYTTKEAKIVRAFLTDFLVELGE